MNELVFKSEKGNPVTTSLLVAQKFEKNHKDVLKAIRNLDCSDEFHKRNFAPMFYISELGNGATRKDPYTVMTRDGFVFLAMGFTGEKAAKFKEEYIDAFNKMEQMIKSQKMDFSDPDTVLMLAQNWRDERMKRIDAENKIVKLQPKADFVDKVIETVQDKVDIGQAAKLLRLPYGRNTLFKELRDRGIFFKNRNEPKQEYIDRQYFEMKEKPIERDNHPAFIVTKILVTQKGLVWLDKLLCGNRSDGKIAKIV